MKNHKVIVINGYSRGGTNILWNVLQSHPDVVSPILETTELLIRARLKGRGWLTRKFLANPVARTAPIGLAVKPWLDSRMYSWKMRNFESRDNGEKSEGVPYTEAEVSSAALCMKSTDKDIVLSDLFDATWDETYFLGLMRNGYAICEAWTRRGKPADYVGRFYRWIGERMIADSERFEHYDIVKFEDLITDPFGVGERVYKFADLQPTTVERLRFKSKRVLDEEGGHEPRFGEENAKYWFDRETVFDLIDPSVSEHQIDNLSASDRTAFEREAMPVLRRFGYA